MQRLMMVLKTALLPLMLCMAVTGAGGTQRRTGLTSILSSDPGGCNV